MNELTQPVKPSLNVTPPKPLPTVAPPVIAPMTPGTEPPRPIPQNTQSPSQKAGKAMDTWRAIEASQDYQLWPAEEQAAFRNTFFSKVQEGPDIQGPERSDPQVGGMETPGNLITLGRNIKTIGPAIVEEGVNWAKDLYNAEAPPIAKLMSGAQPFPEMMSGGDIVAELANSDEPEILLRQILVNDPLRVLFSTSPLLSSITGGSLTAWAGKEALIGVKNTYRKFFPKKFATPAERAQWLARRVIKDQVASTFSRHAASEIGAKELKWLDIDDAADLNQMAIDASTKGVIKVEDFMGSPEVDLWIKKNQLKTKQRLAQEQTYLEFGFTEKEALDMVVEDYDVNLPPGWDDSASFTGGRKGGWNWFKQTWVNYNQPLEDMAKRAFLSGHLLTKEGDARMLVRMWTGMQGHVSRESSEYLRTKIIEPIAKLSHTYNTSVQDILSLVDSYLIAGNAPMREAAFGKGGSGVKNVKKYLKAVDAAIDAHPGLRSEIENIAQITYALNGESLDLAVEYGLITAERAQAAIDKFTPKKKINGKWVKTGQNRYVPFKGFAETDPGLKAVLDDLVPAESIEGVGTNLGVGAAYRRAFGRHKVGLPESPLVNSFLQYHRIRQLAEKNKLVNGLADLVERSPGNKSIYVKEWDYSNTITDPSGKKIYKKIPWRPTSGSSIKFYRDGKIMELELGPGNKALVRAAREMPAKRLRSFIKSNAWVNAAWETLGKVQRFGGQMITTFSTRFPVFNMVRDGLLTAGFTSAEISPKATLTIMKNIPMAMRGLSRGMQEAGPKASKSGNYWAKIADEYELGGFIEHERMFSEFEHLQKSIISQLKTAKQNIDPNEATQMWLAIKQLPELFRVYNNIAENGTRLAVYEYLKHQLGWAHEEAISYTRRVTVDFLQAGEFKKEMQNLYLFANPNIQGTARLAEALQNPKVQKVAAAVAMSSFYYAMFQRIYSGADPVTGQSNYEAIPGSDRDSYIHIMQPGGRANLKMVLPFGLAYFWAFGQITADASFGPMAGQDNTDLIMRNLNAAINAFYPLGAINLENGIGPAVVSASPTIIKTALGPATNVGPFGGPIYPPENPNIATPPDSRRAFGSIESVYRKAAEVLADPLLGIGIEVSPATLKYLINIPYSPGILKEAVDMTATAIDPLKEVRTPIGKGLTPRTPEDFESEQFYKISMELKSMKEELNHTTEKAILKNDEKILVDFLEKNQGKLDVYKSMGKIISKISEYNKKINSALTPVDDKKFYILLKQIERKTLIGIYNGRILNKGPFAQPPENPKLSQRKKVPGPPVV